MNAIVVVAALLVGSLLIFDRYRAFLRRDRLQKFAIAVHQCAKEINQLLNAGYLKYSSWLKARALAQETLNQFCWEPEVDYPDLTTDADFIQLKQIAQWSDPDIENIHRLAKAPGQRLENIKTILNTDAGYLRLDSWRKSKDLAQKTLNRLYREPEVDYLDLTTDADFIQLKQIAQWSDQDIEKFHRLITTVSQCLEEIQSILNTNAGYLRLDSWQQVRDTAQETLNRLYREPAMRYLDLSTEANFNRLKQIAQWSDQDVKKFHRLAKTPSQRLENIKTILNTDAGYLRLSSWRKARCLAQETLNQFCWEPEVDYLDLTTDADFIQLKQIAQWSDQDVKKFHRLAKAPGQRLENIKTILNTDAGYLRLSSWRKAKDLAQKTLNRLRREPAMRYLDLSTEANFIQLKQVAQWSDQDIEKFHRLATAVNQSIEDIKTILNAAYLRTSRWQRIKYQAKKTLNQFNPLENFLERIHHTDFVLLKQIAELRQIIQWSKQDVEEFRKQYVTRCKGKFSAYFDRVESNPLTDRQRDACVIDEDNNLVLAGAGTGKTSTMIGRAGFLIHSGQSTPDQILMLAFANKAAKEMQERLDERVKEIPRTFHKLGRDIIVKVEGEHPSLSPLSEDDALLKNQVGKWLEEEMRDNSSYKEDVLNYVSDYLYPAVNPFDFETKGEYFKYIRANDIRTFKGEKVKSLGECIIDNHLFALGVEYQYEADYEHETRGLNFRQYKPDFYLPKHKIYIEHFGIDRNGNTAPFVDRERYHKDMEWKRNLHEKHQTRLIETYHYELTEGSLQQNLEQKLKKLRVKFDPLSSEEMLEELRKFGTVSALAELLVKLLKACKRDGICPDQIHPEKFPSVDMDQLQRIRTILSPIYELYQNHLKENQEIDFDDMIHKAIDYVESGRFISRWRYILVDEFQDISQPRARLVKALKKSAAEFVGECSLFCVGDDWQSIYRFTGSDIRFTTEFKKKFGPTKITKLDKTFRFNNSICDIASRFILENPTQVRKSLTAHATVKHPAVSLLRQERPDKTNFDVRIDRVLEKINNLAKNDNQFQADGKKKVVYLLGRFQRNLPNKRLVKAWNKQFSVLKIESYTIHTSKGLESDYVVVLGLEGGKHGFPSKKTAHPLLEALLPKLDDFPYAEERRLFYVALTRAKQRVYLIVDMMNASEFVVELLDNNYPLELDEFEIDLAQKYYNQIRCPECETGIMVARERKKGNGKFYGCSYYPLCNYTENGCPKCNNQMRRVDCYYKVCLDRDCNSWIPLCPKCGADMVQQKGNDGTFWGCTNYRGDEENSCRYTEDDIPPPSPPI